VTTPAKTEGAQEPIRWGIPDRDENGEFVLYDLPPRLRDCPVLVMFPRMEGGLKALGLEQPKLTLEQLDHVIALRKELYRRAYEGLAAVGLVTEEELREAQEDC
jgi:hypothetical protein